MKVAIKLGGSVITYKDANEPKAREEVIRRLVYEVSKFQPPFILTHGAGSYGHLLVEKWKRNELNSFYEIHTSVERLNGIVLKYCKQFKLPVDCYSPFNTVSYNGQFNLERLYEKSKESLNKGHVLMTYGDGVLPEKGIKTRYKGFEVLSADVSTCLLAKLWGAEKIIWVIDKDGILDLDGNTIRTIRGNDYRTKFTMSSTDVTGGIEEKLRQSQKSGIRAQVINGLVEGNLTRVLYGDESIGTIVLP